MNISAKIDIKEKCNMIDEYIYMICYRKVEFNIFKYANNAFLKSRRWISFFKIRGKSKFMEIVEANIEEDDESELDLVETFATADGEARFALLSPKDDEYDDD